MTAPQPIVVGVDGSTGSKQALWWAAEEADAHSRPLQVISTWTLPPVPMDPPFATVPWGSDVDLGPATREMLDGLVDEVAEKYPGLSIDRRVLAGSAARELIHASEFAEMVVVGARGHGGFVGMLIGSVSQHVLAHSQCTVVVVR